MKAPVNKLAAKMGITSGEPVINTNPHIHVFAAINGTAAAPAARTNTDVDAKIAQLKSKIRADISRTKTQLAKAEARWVAEKVRDPGGVNPATKEAARAVNLLTAALKVSRDTLALR